MPGMTGKTLYDKIWDAHVVTNDPNGETVLYIDLHLIHEVTTPQAFAGLRAAHRPVRRPDLTLAVADHNIPTEGQAKGVDGIEDAEALEGVTVFHAGTQRVGGKLVTAGGRVLGVTALGADLRAAQARAYEAVSKIHFEGATFRRDIGAKGV